MRVTRVTNEVSALAGTRTARLRVLAGPDAGLELDLPPIGVVIGADRGCDVALTDPSVSARHCTVAPSASGFVVTDLGSRNGTSIDGVAVQKVTAPPGVILRLGHTLVQLLPADEVVAIPPSARDHVGALWGDSPGMRQVFAILERAAQSDASVLFLGESGTGKELAARAVHDESPRRDGPFIVFDCGAATETLVESELFGHVKGAFTGAAADRQGAFAAAHGGTLFLDEIGDLPLALQPKLLRMLEAGEVVPVGGRKPERYDVRVVAATHRDVFGEVARGGFRGDLYYRLAVVEVHLPPLRARKEDLARLVAIFLERVGAAALIPTVGGPALERLAAYHWPGNVRELRNVITRAVALGGGAKAFNELPILLRPTAQAAEPETAIKADRPFHDAKQAVVDRFEREYLTDLLRRSGGNLSAAARLAGLERKFLYKVLERAGLRQKSAASANDDADDGPDGADA
ncbi:MAG: sigma 54-interacting transcriptional regulator [Deltaproteobacteria bacterium]|nr:sigma 54-interacting transcriptional regulator [Kofleriaceae bacterium]